jgi:hypothetical protein
MLLAHCGPTGCSVLGLFHDAEQNLLLIIHLLDDGLEHFLVINFLLIFSVGVRHSFVKTKFGLSKISLRNKGRQLASLLPRKG